MKRNEILRTYDVGVEWEYKVDRYIESAEWETILFKKLPSEEEQLSLEEWLNKLGEDGWNLVVVYGSRFIFKRPKR